MLVRSNIKKNMEASTGIDFSCSSRNLIIPIVGNVRLSLYYILVRSSNYVLLITNCSLMATNTTFPFNKFLFVRCSLLREKVALKRRLALQSGHASSNNRSIENSCQSILIHKPDIIIREFFFLSKTLRV